MDPLELDGAQAHWPLEQPGVPNKQASLKTMGPPELDGALGQQAIIPYSKWGPLRSFFQLLSAFSSPDSRFSSPGNGQQNLSLRASLL